MIKIRIIKDNSGFIWQFIVQGHANYSKIGNDIVCAAVSVTSYTAVGALNEILGFKENELIEVKDGYMSCSIPFEKMNKMSNKKKTEAKIIMETTRIGFKQVEMQYGKYVWVIEENCG